MLVLWYLPSDYEVGLRGNNNLHKIMYFRHVSHGMAFAMRYVCMRGECARWVTGAGGFIMHEGNDHHFFFFNHHGGDDHQLKLNGMSDRISRGKKRMKP